MDKTLSEFILFFLIITSSIITMVYTAKGIIFQNNLFLAFVVFVLSLIIGTIGMIHTIVMLKNGNDTTKKENEYDN